MRVAAAIIVCMCLAGCSNIFRNTIILEYQDFGPQAVAYETIGMEWWQWDSHGASDPYYQYDIKVVVYRNVPLSNVQNVYPVIRESEQDYRYLPYTKAIAYLDNQIQEDLFPELTARLTKTRSLIVEKLGKLNKQDSSDNLQPRVNLSIRRLPFVQ
jgi:hypothetical protein